MKAPKDTRFDKLHYARSLPAISALVVAIAFSGGCANLGQRSERPLNEAQVAGLSPGIGKAELLQSLGPPAEESAYGGLNETVTSWRLVEFGNRLVLFNAHFDPSGRVKYYSRTLDPSSVGTGSASMGE